MGLVIAHPALLRDQRAHPVGGPESAGIAERLGSALERPFELLELGAAQSRLAPGPYCLFKPIYDYASINSFGSSRYQLTAGLGRNPLAIKVFKSDPACIVGHAGIFAARYPSFSSADVWDRPPVEEESAIRFGLDFSGSFKCSSCLGRLSA